jgi:hypothetical protein
MYSSPDKNSLQFHNKPTLLLAAGDKVAGYKGDHAPCILQTNKLVFSNNADQEYRPTMNLNQQNAGSGLVARGSYPS